MEDIKKFKIVTLGCRTNQYESQAYRDQLSKLGFVEAEEGQKADLCIVNSCTVTESAGHKSRQEVRKLVEDHPDGKVVVTGCLVEHASDLKNQFSTIQIVSNKQKEELVQILFPEKEDLPEFKIERFEAHTRAFVKVQDGCNSFCSYCIIPYVRGRSRSKPLIEIVDEVKGLVATGYKEIVLTGINIGDFDGGGGTDKAHLSDLVRAVDAVDGVQRLRISSIDPDEVDDRLLDAVLSCKSACPSMHLVLQSGSPAILHRMRRKYTKDQFLESVERCRAARPDFTFTTDVIVGFPGETEEDFQETMDVLERVQFAKVHMFPYSIRPMTRAARFTDHLPKKIIDERRQRLLKKAEKTAFTLRQGFIGKKLTVLIEEIDSDYARGHSEHFIEVKIKAPDLQKNQIIEVVAIANEADGLIGEVCHGV